MGTLVILAPANLIPFLYNLSFSNKILGMRRSFYFILILFPNWVFGAETFSIWTNPPAGIEFRIPTLEGKFAQAAIDRLKKLECRVPFSISSSTKELHGIVEGEFGEKNISERAVICSHPQQTEFLVLWKGKAQCPEKLFDLKEDDYGTMNSGGWISQRTLIGVPKTEMVTYVKRDHPEISVDHDGFRIGISDIRYCYKGKWLSFWEGD